MGELDEPPVLLERVEPSYPRLARRRQMEGSVLLRFIVDEHGRTSGLQVLRSEPQGVFEESALQAVRNWRFSPGRVEGRAVPVLVEAPIRFQLR